MKNKIISMPEKKFTSVGNQIRKNEDIFYAEIDGKEIGNLSEYFESVSRVFHFPRPASIWDVYNDWMRDFTWIDKDNIVFVIRHYGKFMRNDILNRKEVIDDFQELFFPWWEEEVVHHVVGGKPKKFTVYLLD